MKRIFLLALLCLMAFIQGCSKTEDAVSTQQVDTTEVNLPKASREYGKSVAKEVRNIALNLYKKGIDYTQATKSPIVRKQVIGELFSDIPAVKKASLSEEPLSFEISVPEENIEILTERQLNTINEIYADYNTSKSNEEFFGKLKITTDKIYKLPKIEQDRVFNLSATLYYGLQEIENLTREGLIASEREIISCKKFILDVYTFPPAIGYTIIIRGVTYIVTSSVSVAAGTLWIVTACLLLKGDTPDYRARCSEIYARCMNSSNPYWSRPQVGASMTRCGDCLNKCIINQGTWICSFNFH